MISEHKTCVDCKKKLLASKYFYKSPTSKDGFQVRCKKCAIMKQYLEPARGMNVTNSITFVSSRRMRTKVVIRKHLGGLNTVEFDVGTLKELGIHVDMYFSRKKGFVAVKGGPVWEINQCVDWGDK